MAVAERRGAACLAVDGLTAQTLPETWRAAWPSLFTRGPILVQYRDLREAARERMILLVHEGRIEAWTAFAPRHRRELAERWRRIVERIRTGAEATEDEGDELVEG